MNPDFQARTRQFRAALGTFATGVTIVTTRNAAGEDIGLTANSFNSVSLDPPMVLWSLMRKSLSLPAFLESGYFAVHVLAVDQEDLSVTFATRGADKFAGLPLTRGAGGIPLIPGCSALFQCKTAFNYEGGDHVIFVGEVQDFEHFDRAPLVFHSGRYAVAVEKPAASPAPSREDGEPDSSFSQDFLIYLLERAHFQLFLNLRRDLERHGLSEDQWFVLSILGTSDNRTVAELDRLLWYTGRRVTYELLANLTTGGFARLHGSYDPHARVTLTETGKRVVIELVAMAKAAESDAERNLGYGETQLLKRALRGIIRETDPGALPLQPPHFPE
jgi:flavin reductase (DIM6/NTAB) family NADH-FMN oxidoreductase RutF/DNA-binding MarR family transcriptional regulator